MLAAVAAALKDDEAAEEPPAPAAGAWDGLADHAVAAIKGDAERRLLWRVAEARGQRVSLSELSSNFGLPAAPSLEHDFPELHAFCAEHPTERPIPVLFEGDDGDGWYRMAWRDANAFVWAFEGQGAGAMMSRERARRPSSASRSSLSIATQTTPSSACSGCARKIAPMTCARGAPAAPVGAKSRSTRAPVSTSSIVACSVRKRSPDFVAASAGAATSVVAALPTGLRFARASSAM